MNFPTTIKSFKMNVLYEAVSAVIDNKNNRSIRPNADGGGRLRVLSKRKSNFIWLLKALLETGGKNCNRGN